MPAATLAVALCFLKGASAITVVTPAKTSTGGAFELMAMKP